MASTAAPEPSRRPQDSNFYQQRLKAWQPILTPKWVVISFVVVGVIFLPLGFILKAASDSVVEFKVQYDGSGAETNAAVVSGQCQLPKDSPPANTTCTITIMPDEDMEPPVYVYYELENFYQNHRRYVKSRSDEQLRAGDDFPAASTSDCDPLQRRTVGGMSKKLWPCGLIANSMFNDTITLAGGPHTLRETGIAWKSDREDKFKSVPEADKNARRNDFLFLDDIYPGVLPPDDDGLSNEHFIVWMRTAALPQFRKLYGRIDTKVQKGQALQFDIVSRFRVASFDGKKSLVVSTTSWLGGKNPFLGIAYIVVGALCLVLALFFGLKQRFGGRNLGDTNLLVWNTSRR